MIRNNQNRRRRGGGGGPRPQQMGGGNNYGNRLDNRQRGNATQLLEKYRNLARDAQQAGDRVTAEYYLQYAEHYYRILGDYRDRQPDQAARRANGYEDDSAGFQNSEGADDADEGEDGDVPYASRDERQPRNDDRQPQRFNGDDRRYTGDRYTGDDRQPRSDDRQPRSEDRQPRDERPRYAEGERAERAPRPNREFRQPRDNGGQRRDWNGEGREAAPAREERFAAADESAPLIAGLPGPARIAEPEPVAVVPEGDEAAAPRRRGRPRKVAAEAVTES